VVNPLRIKGYASTNMQRNKTDRVDAQLIASFCLMPGAGAMATAEHGN
jgi:transposase